jgi:hypothetical protein
LGQRDQQQAENHERHEELKQGEATLIRTRKSPVWAAQTQILTFSVHGQQLPVTAQISSGNASASMHMLSLDGLADHRTMSA